MKLVEKIKEKKNQIGVAALTTAMTLAPTCLTHAAEGDVTTSMTTAMTQVKTDSLGAISAVAPIGISIMGAFLVWRYGIRFFKSISK